MTRTSSRIVLAILILLLLPQLVKANRPENTVQPRSKAEFCERRAQPGYALALSENPDNRMAFENEGGLFNGGVCWWHSLFQRAALYLSVFRPDLPKPDRKHAKKIIHSLASGKKVVEIPGYDNFNDFSRDWETEIQDKLEEWQKVDGFLKFAWIKGLSGSPHIAPLKLEKKVQDLLQLVKSTQDIHWTMLQMDGITAHAALILGGRTQLPLYGLTNIDSNMPSTTEELVYRSGDRSIYHPFYVRLVPYIGRRSDLKRFKEAANRYCSPNKSAAPITEDLNNGLE